MGFEYKGPPASSTPQQPVIPAQQSSAARDEDTQPRRAVQPTPVNPDPIAVEPVYREHVTFSPGAPPAQAPGFYPEHLAFPQPAQAPFAGQPLQPQQQQKPSYQVPPTGQPQPGYYPYGYNYAGAAPPQLPYLGYPGHYGAAAPPFHYPYYGPYMWQPPRPRRDNYLFGVAITAFICSILVLVGGLISGFFLLVTSLEMNTSTLPAEQIFSSMALFTGLTIAGLVGGGFSLYHSIRALFLKKPSIAFKLPHFWIFLVLYVLLAVVGFLISNGTIVVNIAVNIALIALAGILPALTFLSLAVRRLRYPRKAQWPTTWRRFTLAVVSGATSAIVLASIFELILTLLATLEWHANTNIIDNPNLPTPHDPSTVALMLVIVSVIAPLVEEGVKPLAALLLIGRMRSAAEAFILGMSCGIGFDLIETSGYIGMGGQYNWIYIALERSVAGLLHGFGAGMVALGWYYFTHKKSLNHHRILVGVGCCVYAVLQHAIWNGSFVLQLLPAPIGPYLENGVIKLGGIKLPAFLIVEIVLSVLMLIFFLYVTGKIRKQPPAEQTTTGGMPQTPPLQQQAYRPASV